VPTATKIHKGDTVLVMTGKDKGKRGKVQRVVTKTHRALVENVNMVKRHRGRTSVARQGGIITMEAPVSLSNLMLICPRCSKAARVGHRVVGDGDQQRKLRICKKCNETID
jgi:large subunit ribosomal protein L24